jgi:hypothetical protein
MINNTNEKHYQTPKFLEPAKKADCQSLENIDWIAESYERLRVLSALSANWDGRDAESPNDTALHWTKEVLKILFRLEFSPTNITPSVENGVGISFIPCGIILSQKFYNFCRDS